MKNISYIINGILAIAVIILFILHFTGKKGGSNTETISIAGDSAVVRLPVAYIDQDSLLRNYNFSKDLNERLMRKWESSTASINQKKQALAAEVIDYENKVRNSAFLGDERRQQEAVRIQKKGQELDEFAARLNEEFNQEQLKMNLQLNDTVITLLKEFNKGKKYQIIFNNEHVDNIFLADDVYNITKEVIDFLNNRYTPSQN